MSTFPPNINNPLYLAYTQAGAASADLEARLAPPAGGRTNVSLTTYLNNNAVFNVRDCGAVGDGVTNDTTAFNVALAALVSVGGGTIYLPRGTYVVSASLTLPAYCVMRGESRSSLVTFTGTSGAFLYVGDSLTQLNYKCAVRDFGLVLTGIATTGIKLRNTSGASLRDMYIEGPTSNYGTRTNIGVDIDAGNVSTFFNSIDSVLCNHMHIGFKIESTGTSYATNQNFVNCSSTGDKSLGDTTSKGFWFTRTPVVTAFVGNGEGSVITGGNVEDCGTGVHIEGGGITVWGLRCESNTLDVLLDTNSGNNTIGGSSTLSTVTDNSAAGSCNSASLTANREGSYTATMTPTTGTVTLTSGAGGDLCTYVKEGRKVTVWGQLSIASVSTPGGAALAITLPFTCKTGANNAAPAAILGSGLKASAITALQGNVASGTNQLLLYKMSAGANTTLVGDVQAGTVIMFSCTYLATA